MTSIKTPSQLAAYADLFERLLDCTLLLDPETLVVLENNGACERVLQLVGTPLETMVGQVLTNWVDDDCREEFEKGLRIAMRRYYPRQFDTRFKLADGRILHMDVLACPLELADGRKIIQIIARDITSRREAEEKVQRLLVDLQGANAKLEVISTVDEMTGLFNFRHFKSELSKEHIRSVRFKTNYSIVFCDVDHFKKYNDRNGHPAGDQLLKEFAATLQKVCRSSDLVARYGGEEFAVICPGVDCAGAAVLAERIRLAVTQTVYPFGEFQPLGQLTISIGVSSYPEHGSTPEQVLKAADEGVYQSKAGGRNRVSTPPTKAKDVA